MFSDWEFREVVRTRIQSDAPLDSPDTREEIARGFDIEEVGLSARRIREIIAEEVAKKRLQKI